MNFPGEFYYSNNYIDCISFTPPPKIILSNSEPIFLNSVISTEWLILHLDIYFSVYIYMFPSKSCVFQCRVRDFQILLLMTGCVFPRKISSLSDFLPVGSLNHFFFVDILFCFTILKFYFILRYIHNYTIARRLKIECDSMYIEK